MKRIWALFVLCAGIMPAFGCDRSLPTTPTTVTGPTSALEAWTGSITAGETQFYPVTVGQAVPVHVTLGSLTDGAGNPLTSTVTLTFGVESADFTTCNPLVSASVTPSLQAQIGLSASPGQYCVGLTDTAGLPGTVNFTVRLLYGVATDADTSGVINYSSTVVPGGFTARSFASSVPGPVAIALDSISPSAVGALGIGLGIQRNDGSGCELTGSAIVSAGNQFVLSTDAGVYCVKVFDPGTLTDTASFSLRILHP